MIYGRFVTQKQKEYQHIKVPFRANIWLSQRLSYYKDANVYKDMKQRKYVYIIIMQGTFIRKNQSKWKTTDELAESRSELQTQ
jgi:hypothetical protein